MRKTAAVGVLVVLLAATAAVALQRRAPGAAEVSAAVPTPTLTPTAKPGAVPTPTRTPVVVRSPAPAANLAAFASGCIAPMDHGGRVMFLWGPSQTGPQWLDLSIFNDGFAPENFVGVGPFDGGTWGFMWDGLLQGTTHYARVNTLTRAGWMSSATFAFYTPVCDVGAYAPAPAGDMLALRDRIAAAIADSGIDTAVAVTDLRTRETIDVNGGAVRLPGCTINLFALIQSVADLQAGRYAEAAPGDLIARTIFGSNPVTARQLIIDYIGGGDLERGVRAVNDFAHALGMADTLMDHPPAFPYESFYGGGSNRITALDVNRGLQGLWDGRVLLPGWRDYLLQKMTGVKPGLNYLIPAGVGSGATVSHKNGFLFEEGWADNDIGIVWFERDGTPTSGWGNASPGWRTGGWWGATGTRDLGNGDLG
jgi:beta-lactamase class A